MQEVLGKMNIPNSKSINYRISTYTLEQKIVAAVWHHERLFTGMSYEQLQLNFLIRFNTEYPKYATLKRWERQLFGGGFIPNKPNRSKAKHSLGRLLHVPYVKESLVRYPDLTIKERADMLGMPKYTLRAIFKKDLKESDINNIKKANRGKDRTYDCNVIPKGVTNKGDV